MTHPVGILDLGVGKRRTSEMSLNYLPSSEMKHLMGRVSRPGSIDVEFILQPFQEATIAPHESVDTCI